MLRSVFAFEVRYHLRSAVFWLSAAVFFLLAFGAVTTDTVQIGGAIGNVNRNAPYVISQFVLVMSVLASFVIVAFVAGAVLRDTEHGTAGLLFTTRLRKRDYVLGRFAGAYTVSVLVMVAVALAVLVGSAMPWLEPERIGPVMPGAYLRSFAFLVLPDLLLMSAVLFGLATLTRSMMGSYLGLVAFFVAYAVAMVLLSDVENEDLAVLLDPFGFGAFSVATQYWTTFERNTRLLELEGPLLWNRLLWLSVAAVIGAVTYARFSMTTEAAPVWGWRKPGARRGRRAPAAATAGAVGAAGAAARRELPEAPSPGVLGRAEAAAPSRPRFGASAVWAQLRHQTAFEVRGVVRSLPFGILLVMGMFNVVGAASQIEQFAGTPVHPRTHLMITVLQGSFLLFAVVILAFYAGELVWRDREKGMDGILGALPVPNHVYWGGKMAALAVVVFGVLAVGTLTAVAIQLYHGYTELEPGLYLLGVGGLVGWPFLLIAVLALTAQVVTNQKYVGFLVMVLYFVSLPVLDALDLVHNLYRYAQAPPTPYSDMNGYGHFLGPAAWLYVYWSLVAVALLVVTHLLWVRGADAGWRSRLRLAGLRLRGGWAAPVLVASLLGAAATGGWIAYNTNVLNDFVSPDEARDRQAAYETLYGRYRAAPQPRITAARTEVDLWPAERAVDLRGTYELLNTTSASIDSLHFTVPPELEVRSLEVPGGRSVRVDSTLGYRIYALDAPLAPGDRMSVRFEVGVRPRGFANHAPNTDLVHNGTFLNSFAYLPHVGYQAVGQLVDPNERRKRGLPPVERMPPPSDSANLARSYISGEADWIDFSTVVSTRADQIALAPGYLERAWTEGDRRYFEYAMDAPILPFWAYLSADWTVARDRWRDVEIAVYHDPAHPYNVERMIEATQASLDYFTREFGPYQHRQVRIVEFPRYARFAQSFPNTIPFSESIGFIARLDDPDAVDYVFYVTAHEVAHQWWAHQVVGANVQGATVLSETLAQYSALMVMEDAYGPEKMRRFLRYELDSYLEGRGGELLEELPLELVENQGYVHYRKGSLVMYALKDYLGEDALNRQIRRFLDDTKYGGPPYPTAGDFLAYLEGAVPPGQDHLLDDLFRTITLWDLGVTEATAEPLDGGRWRVRLVVEGRKVRATGEGEESEIEMADLVDVGVFGAETDDSPPEGEVLFLEKRVIRSGTDTIEVVVDSEPRQVGIDPFSKLIDRSPDDNLRRVRG